MALPLIPLLLGAGALALLFGSHQAEFAHLPKPLAQGIRDNLASNNNVTQLSQLAAQLRFAAAEASARGDSGAAADYSRAADLLDKKVSKLRGNAPVPIVPGVVASPGLDPVAQATQILTQAGPLATSIPGILVAAPAGPLPTIAAPQMPFPAPTTSSPGFPPSPTPPFFPGAVNIPAPIQTSIPMPPAQSLPTSVSTPAGDIPLHAPTHYLVASGDFPYKIAARFGLSLGQLASANPSQKSNIVNGKIFTGQTLSLPPNAIDHGPIAHASGHTAA